MWTYNNKKRTINYQNIAWTREKKIDNNILLEKLDSFKKSDFEIKPMPVINCLLVVKGVVVVI